MEIVAQLRDNIPAIASQGMLSTFGGAVDLGESPKQAAVRELEEETCLNTTYIKSCLHRPVLNSLFSNFASLAPSRLNHSNTTGIDITTQITRLSKGKKLMEKEFTVGQKVRVVAMPPYVKTAERMPMLRPANVIAIGDEGIVVDRRPGNYWGIHFEKGAFLLDSQYIEAVETIVEG